MKGLGILTVSLAMVCGATAAMGVWEDTCIPDGGSASLCADVKLGPRISMAASAKEDDVIGDDDLGEPSIDSKGDGVYSVCVSITNEGGALSGPNGEVQNGGVEGDCIEVYLEIHLQWPSSGGISGPGGGGNWSGVNTGTKDSSMQEFCPC